MRKAKKKLSILLACALLLSLCACAGQERENRSVEIRNIDKTPVLFHGTAIYRPDEQVNYEFAPEELLSYIRNKYEITYYGYSNGEYQHSYDGTVASDGYYGEWCVDEGDGFWAEVSLSADIKNPYPREIKEFSLDNQIVINATAQIEERFEMPLEAVNALAVDLDDCGRDEYILYVCNQDEYAHYVCLLDKDGEIVAYLIELTSTEDEIGWIDYRRGADANRDKPYYLYDFEEDMEIIDCDGDGIYEIFCAGIYYEGWGFGVWKYNRGIVNQPYPFMERMFLTA